MDKGLKVEDREVTDEMIKESFKDIIDSED